MAAIFTPPSRRASPPVARIRSTKLSTPFGVEKTSQSYIRIRSTAASTGAHDGGATTRIDGCTMTSAPASASRSLSRPAVRAEPATRTVAPNSGRDSNQESDGLRSTTLPTTNSAGGRTPRLSTTSATVPSVHRTVCCRARLHHRTMATGVSGSRPCSIRAPLQRAACFTPM